MTKRPVYPERRQAIARYPGTCVECGRRYATDDLIEAAGLSWAHPECEPVLRKRVLAEVHADLAAFERSIAGKNTRQLDRAMTWLIDRGLSFEAQLMLERAYMAALHREQRFDQRSA